ncbi:hypothetical protein HER10_EVM0013047 [Colletotrichum scovillei]|uniref:Mucoidy inhibitor-like protein n=1 Tax=Colletotrichum scovillei TaxID=1209932 RepID=A0A9P7UH11_9PEZI|nr:uncharacterized protein HER10_EVM0013047 [Colletotrichum scovillei]KAF4774441.1 hypothetical protein HER10_EVM0013047 [Colletotrichum scovillei]KAG7056079.1 mucoidy inhibitor-like protein [Colletotrichum scovillei]KAG7075522.1 mucoidy inhibitor-like protein [Colletotrichum scovillei]KAG7082673.1 mucoidy inhibitor-like protein [Colletotrichum scovillei]
MSDIAHNKEYHVRDLATRSVTLYPNSAQLVRDLRNLQLKPGANEITIFGLTPTIDESTIKVDGAGSAIITDIAIELVPNRESFQDVYPDSDDEMSDADVPPEEDGEDEEESEEKEPSALDKVRARIRQLRDEERSAKEVVESAANRLKILDAHGASLESKEGVNIADSIETYRAERERIFQDHVAGVTRGQDNMKRLSIALKQETRLVKRQKREAADVTRAAKKARKERDRQAQKDAREKAKLQKEKARIRAERERFWPKLCYSVRVSLEVMAFTPSSSRRTSVSSETAQAWTPAPDRSDEGKDIKCDLSLSYVTSSAFWAPSYDLQLFTTNNTGILCYDARITNKTSETWSNCKVVLSTSQATFAGLENAIPILKPWNIKLAPKEGNTNGTDILSSREERQQRSEWWRAQQTKAQPQKPRSDLFGVDHNNAGNSAANLADYQQSLMVLNQDSKHRRMMYPAQGQGQAQHQAQIQAQVQAQQMQQMQAQQMQVQQMQQMQQMPQIQRPAHVERMLLGGSRRQEPIQEPMGSEASEEDENLDFQESTVEETGFTTTYDLPGTKTLPPRPTASKQRVARINFSNIAFSHTIIAKYKPVAYLKARIRNSSRLTLLRAEAGLTLDGTFMGRTHLPRCSAGDVFSLGLGIDPAIKVNYPKVDVRRTTTGLFSKENSSVYSRSITVFNSRASAGKPVSLLVLDQVPVSEDERLKVDILAPKGLVVDGSGVSTGQPARESKQDVDWGQATATLKGRQGQVEWQVKLNAGKAVKLGLEYVVALPTGDSAMECS